MAQRVSVLVVLGLFALVISACGVMARTGDASSSAALRSTPSALVQTVAPTTVVAPTQAPTPTGPLAAGFDGGGEWINSAPLKLTDLRGKVVLVNFWTYGCYNCQNTLPFEKVWWETYKDQDFVIVGVHSPEFASEEKLENVQAAVIKAGITWPVVQDNQHTIWNAYGNRYWPRFYLIDETGHIIYDHIGEGGYDEMDSQIAAALQRAKG